MGKKYIIEIPEDKIADFVGSTHFLMPYMMAGHVGHHDTGLPIEPYTDPDLEQVRKESYKEGREAGIKDGKCEAWEASKKIINMPFEERRKIFVESLIQKIHSIYTASEAIEKIRQYEQIQIGDEVERILNGEVDSKAVFLEDNEGYYRCLFWTGCCFTTLSYPKEQFRKTGRHFDEIATVLEKMREESNG